MLPPSRCTRGSQLSREWTETQYSSDGGVLISTQTFISHLDKKCWIFVFNVAIILEGNNIRVFEGGDAISIHIVEWTRNWALVSCVVHVKCLLQCHLHSIAFRFRQQSRNMQSELASLNQIYQRSIFILFISI